MTKENGFSTYKGFWLTEKGFEIRQLVTSGGDDYIVRFTRGCGGRGRPGNEADIYKYSDVREWVLDIPVMECPSEKASYQMALVIDNAEYQEGFGISELGLYAEVENATKKEVVIPEVLYGYTYSEGVDYIADSASPLYREIKLNTLIQKQDNITIEYDRSKVYLTKWHEIAGVQDFTATFYYGSNNWLLESPYYVQTVAVKGLKEEMSPVYDLDSSFGNSTSYLTSWGRIAMLENSNGYLKAYATNRPNENLRIRIKGV